MVPDLPGGPRGPDVGGTSGLGARLADAGGALAGVVEGAFSVFEQVMKTQEQNRTGRPNGPGPRAPAPARLTAGKPVSDARHRR